MFRPVEKMKVIFFKLAKVCEARGVNCLIRIPHSSVEV